MLALERKIALTFSALVLLLIALAAFSVHNALHTAATFREIDRTNRLLRAVETVMLDVLNIQTATRGFLLTGEENFLDPYRSGATDIRRALDELVAASAHDAIQTQRAQRVREIHPALDSLIEERLAARRQGDFAPEAMLANLRAGKALVDEIRGLVEAIEQDERAVLRSHSAAAQSGARRTFILLTALGIFAGSSLIYAGVRATRDVHARVRAEQALREMNDELERRVARRTAELAQSTRRLQRLSARLLDIQESERRTLAQELHDELGQAMTAVKLGLQALQRTPPGAAALAAKLQHAIDLTNGCLEQTRSLSLNLHPPMLEDLGLAPTLRWLVSRFAETSGPRIIFEDTLGEARPTAVIEVACFRIVQESLTNIQRHARAQHATLSLNRDGCSLIASVSDDGVGFDAAAARERAMQQGLSLGLLGLEERASLAGGTLRLDSSPGRGTRVTAIFPQAFSA